MVADVATRHKNLGPQNGNLKKNRQIMTRISRSVRWGVLIVVCMLAQATRAETLGPVTNMPLPRYVSMKASEGNVRRGPSLTHRIDWVFTRRDMPLQITAGHGHWRRVEDREGQGGWVHYSLLSGVRTVIVEQDMLSLHVRPDPTAPIAAALEVGVIGRLGECGPEWCFVRSGGFKGWAPKVRLWGVGPTELRD